MVEDRGNTEDVQAQECACPLKPVHGWDIES